MSTVCFGLGLTPTRTRPSVPVLLDLDHDRAVIGGRTYRVERVFGGTALYGLSLLNARSTHVGHVSPHGYTWIAGHRTALRALYYAFCTARPGHGITTPFAYRETHLSPRSLLRLFIGSHLHGHPHV